MGYLFEDLEKSFSRLNDSIEKSLEEIRRSKAAVQRVLGSVIQEKGTGQYIRDEKRIVISAPEIIIGNVDVNGNLWSDAGSQVTIRANGISLEGSSGSYAGGGSISCRASSIRNIAVDPGIDGKENVVCPLSEVVSVARSVCLSGSSSGDFSVCGAAAGQGVSIHSDTYVSVDASGSAEIKSVDIDERLSLLKEEKSTAKQTVSSLKGNLSKVQKKLTSLFDEVNNIGDDIEDIRANEGFLDDKKYEITRATAVLVSVFNDYSSALSELAETCRLINCLEAEKKALPKADDFKKKSSCTGVLINGETVNLTSVDGDGNVRTNPGAGVFVKANKVCVSSRDHDSTLLKEGEISLEANSVNISTADIKYKDQKKRDSAEIPAAGDVHIVSKNLLVESVDYELANKEIKEKALTKDGKMEIRVESVNVSSTDTEGKAVGKLAFNAKEMELKSFDVKKEDRKDDKIAAGGSILLTAEKIAAGSRDKDNKTKQMQLSADKLGIFGDTTAEVQQGEGKAVVQLDGGNLSVSGGKTQLFGETTVNGKTSFKADVEAPKATIQNLEAKSSFKSTNISDGIAVPAAPSTAKLSAKLKFEENKSK